MPVWTDICNTSPGSCHLSEKLAFRCSKPLDHFQRPIRKSLSDIKFLCAARQISFVESSMIEDEKFVNDRALFARPSAAFVAHSTKLLSRSSVSPFYEMTFSLCIDEAIELVGWTPTKHSDGKPRARSILRLTSSKRLDRRAAMEVARRGKGGWMQGRKRRGHVEEGRYRE